MASLASPCGPSNPFTHPGAPTQRTGRRQRWTDEGGVHDRTQQLDGLPIKARRGSPMPSIGFRCKLSIRCTFPRKAVSSTGLYSRESFPVPASSSRLRHALGKRRFLPEHRSGPFPTGRRERNSGANPWMVAKAVASCHDAVLDLKIYYYTTSNPE